MLVPSSGWCARGFSYWLLTQLKDTSRVLLGMCIRPRSKQIASKETEIDSKLLSNQRTEKRRGSEAGCLLFSCWCYSLLYLAGLVPCCSCCLSAHCRCFLLASLFLKLCSKIISVSLILMCLTDAKGPSLLI